MGRGTGQGARLRRRPRPGRGLTGSTRRNAPAASAITGWARNLPDGRVEVLAEGAARHVERFLDRLRAGPSLARVDSFDVRREAATGEFPDFRVVYFSG